MAKKGSLAKSLANPATPASGRPSALPDIRGVYCTDNLEQLAKPALSLSNGLPDACCVNLIYIDPAPASEAEPTSVSAVELALVSGAELTSVSAVELPFNLKRNSVHYV
jgi:hypothetical protein